MSASLNRVRGHKRRGFALILTSLMMVFIVSLMGMAVDAGVLFAVRSRLSSAVDSAALAASRSLHLGASQTEANEKARQAAERFLRANFPNGYLGVDPAQTRLSTAIAARTQANRPTGLLDISVRAQVSAPVYFMKFWGVPSVQVSVEGHATRRSLVVVMVLDKSGSMGERESAGGTLPGSLSDAASPCESMVFAASQLPDFFSPYDEVGLVSYHDTASTDYPTSPAFKAGGQAGIKNKIAQLACGGSASGGNPTAALEAAYQEIRRVDQKQALNTILLLTDGAPNGINASFPLRTSIDTRLGPAVESSLPPQHPDRVNCLNPSGRKECVDMPVACPSGQVTGVLTERAGFALESGPRLGLLRSFPADAAAAFPAGCPSSGTAMTSQSLAFIPDTDRFGNSTRGPKDNWAFQVNEQCAPANLAVTPGNARCKSLGAEWSQSTGEWTGKSAGSNFFTAGPYAGRFRPDQANAIAAASMNALLNQAARIRGDASYHVRIDSVYLQGNGPDPVDRDFLAMVSNLETIPPVPYEPPGSPNKPNPAYDPKQAQGTYSQAVHSQALGGIFADVAASLVRLTQ